MSDLGMLVGPAKDILGGFIGRGLRDALDEDTAATEAIDQHLDRAYSVGRVRENMTAIRDLADLSSDASLTEIFSAAGRVAKNSITPENVTEMAGRQVERMAVGAVLSGTGLVTANEVRRNTLDGYQDRAASQLLILESSARDIPYYDYDNNSVEAATSDAMDQLQEIEENSDNFALPGVTRLVIPVGDEVYRVIIDATNLDNPVNLEGLDLETIDLADPSIAQRFAELTPHIYILNSSGINAGAEFVQAVSLMPLETQMDIQGNITMAASQATMSLTEIGSFRQENGFLVFDQGAYNAHIESQIGQDQSPATDSIVSRALQFDRLNMQNRIEAARTEQTSAVDNASDNEQNLASRQQNDAAGQSNSLQ